MAEPLTPPSTAEIKARILAGETIPLDDLRRFILASNQILERQKKEAVKPTDVDFF